MSTIISVVLLILYIALCVLHHVRKKKVFKTKAAYVRTILWPLAFASILAGLCYIFANGFYFGNNPIEPVAACALIFSLGLTGIFSQEISNATQKLLSIEGKKYYLIKLVVGIVSLVVLSIVAFACIELAFNFDVSKMSFEIRYEFFFLMTLIALFYFTGSLWKPLCAVLFIALSIFGIANELIYVVRGTVLTPGDLMVLNTAMEVSSRVSLRFEASSLATLCMLALGFALLIITPRLEKDTIYKWIYSKLSKKLKKIKKDRTIKVLYYLKNIAFGLVAVVIASNLYTAIIDKAGAKFATWKPVNSYQSVGVLSAHIIQFDRLRIQEPAGYSDEAAAKLLAKYSQAFDESDMAKAYAAASAEYKGEKPTVIGIMNESYSDLSILKLVQEAGYTAPVGTTNISDAVQNGSYFVKVLGGGTANSEFEFLTGASMNYIGEGKYPYTLYDLSDVDSLVRQFKDEGYSTTAIHPEDPTNYSRQTVYKALGFDSFISKADFKKDPLAQEFHAGYSDESTYNKILELLKSNDDPQFIFDVTMQNHQGYDMNNIPKSLLTDYKLPIFDAYDNGQLNEYLTCIKESDAALERFITELRQIDKPVILVFFGDHMPTVASWIADNTPGLDGIDKTLAQHTTRYLMWANYKLDGATQDNATIGMSSSNLGAYLCAAAGVPLTDFQKATLFAAQTFPNSSRGLLQDAKGTWWEISDPNLPEDMRQTYDDMDIIQYMTFAKKVQ